MADLPRGVIDIASMRSGKWTAKSFSHVHDHTAYWHCECDCGTKRPVAGINIRRKRSKSCGECGKAIDRKPEIRALHAQHVNKRQIAKRVGVSLSLVKKACRAA